MPASITSESVTEAAAIIGTTVARTPCPESHRLSDLAGCRVYCKLENLQRTGSFKERSAAHVLARLPDPARRRGVIAASAGNHATALAYHAERLGIPVTVVMPKDAPLAKVQSCRRLGARVVLHGEGFGDARRHADELAAEASLTYIHGFDNPHVIAGQGTAALEIIEQAPDVEAIVVPVGGGGLIAGIAAALAERYPEIEVIGVEPERSASWAAATASGAPVDVPPQPTLADGLAVPAIGELAFAVARPHVGRVVRVSEDDLSLAVLRLLEMEKSVVEGAGAASLAALMHPDLADLAGRCVVIMLCGGNIDPLVLRRVIEYGLARDGRLVRLLATVSDRPGGLNRFTHAVAQLGGSIQHLQHDRVFAGPDVHRVRIDCTIETRDRQHADLLQAELADAGFIETVERHPDPGPPL